MDVLEAAELCRIDVSVVHPWLLVMRCVRHPSTHSDYKRLWYLYLVHTHIYIYVHID